MCLIAGYSGFFCGTLFGDQVASHVMENFDLKLHFVSFSKIYLAIIDFMCVSSAGFGSVDLALCILSKVISKERKML